MASTSHAFRRSFGVAIVPLLSSPACAGYATQSRRSTLTSWTFIFDGHRTIWRPPSSSAVEGTASLRITTVMVRAPVGGRPLSELNDRVIDTFIKRFSGVVVVSEHVRADLERRVCGLRPTNIYNGVVLPSPRRKQSFHGTYLLFVGRLVPTKGLRDLLAAVATCRDEHGIVEMRLRIVGLGPEERRLRRQAAKLGLGDCVDFCGYVPDREKEELMAGCRIFCMPSHRESFGMAAVEAMALGCPIVACDVEGLPEAVAGGGILVPPRSPAALTKALAVLWNDEAARRSYGSAGLAHAQTFPWQRTVFETERLFETLCSPRSKSVKGVDPHPARLSDVSRRAAPSTLEELE